MTERQIAAQGGGLTMKSVALAAAGLAALALAIAGAFAVRGLAPSPAAIEEGRAYTAAHNKMMSAMTGERVATSGDADADFAMLMIPHHQGAVDMAKVELQYGTDPQMRALAQRVAAAQQPQIDQMSAWRKAHPPTATAEATPARAAFTAASNAMMDGMMANGMAHSGDGDLDFVQAMISHHQGAIDMAEAALKFGKDPGIRTLAQKIIADQRAEIAEMTGWLRTKGH